MDRLYSTIDPITIKKTLIALVSAVYICIVSIGTLATFNNT